MLLTTKQAAEYAQVSERTIRRLINAKRLTATAYGSAKRPNWRIDTIALREIVENEIVFPTLTPPVRHVRRRRASSAGSARSLLSAF
jgi:excisionase family DNA binding protein